MGSSIAIDFQEGSRCFLLLILRSRAMVRKRKEDFSKFMSSILQNSMLTGIPQIASAATGRQRALRALIFLLCLVGFVYQSWIFMELYYEYKTTVDIMVTFPKVVDLPGVTVCSPNPVQNDLFCAESSPYRHLCKRLKNETGMKWCECFPRYCHIPTQTLYDIWIPTMDGYYTANVMTQEEVGKYSESLKQMFLQCYTNKAIVGYEDCNYALNSSFRVKGEDPAFLSNCYAINSLVGRPDTKPVQGLSRDEITIILPSDGKNYGYYIKTINHQVYFHDQRTLLNPFLIGYNVLPGFKTEFFFKKEIKILLPPPYETNCRDYVAEWKSRGGHGPMNQRTCIDECRSNASYEIRGCQQSMFSQPIQDPNLRCYDQTEYENVTALSEVCELDCRPACYEETYVVRREAKSMVMSSCAGDNVFRDLSWLDLYLDGMETTIYTYSPKYQIIETFSYLGGYVGMWLGISLVAVFDFVETLVEMCKYPCRKWMLFRQKKARVHRMKSVQWTL